MTRALPRWTFGLVVVASVHLLTTTGAWEVTDHGEQLLVAQRLLTRGTLHLWDPGDPPLRRYGVMEEVSAPGRPVLSRFLPLTSLTLLPLLWLDRLIGWGAPAQFGRLVHLHGHIFVLLGLGLLGYALRRTGASEGATVATVTITGLSWPSWMIARRLGPEPLLYFLVALFVSAGLVEKLGARWARPAQCAVCALLPWVNPTGPLIGGALVLGSLAEHAYPRPELRRILAGAGPTIAGFLVGMGSVLFVWNHLYQGNWLQGGYAPYAVPFVLRDPTLGLLRCPEALFCGAPILLGTLLYGVWKRPGWDPARWTALALTACVPVATSLTVLFVQNIPLTRGEATRRLAVLLPAWGAVLGTSWDRMKVPPVAARILVAAAVIPGVALLSADQSNYYFTPGGIFFFPWILWLDLLSRGFWLPALVAACVLLGLLAWSGSRVFEILRGEGA